MSNAQRLDQVSGIFFFTGFMLSKLQYVPFSLVSAVFRFLSLGLYLAGYGLWFAASLLHPGQKQHENKWYGFAQIKEQFLFSSLLGFIATALSVAAVFIPLLFPPAAWLFVVGNVIWTIGEYHKLKNPPANDEKYSHTQQKAYLNYAITTTSISFITAVSATLMVIFPPVAIPITVFSLLLCVGLGGLALEYWLNSSFGDHKPSKTPASYFKIEDALGYQASHEHDLSHEPAPYHTKSLFSSTESIIQVELQPLNPTTDNTSSGMVLA